MRWVAVPCAIFAVLLIGSAARAASCEVELENDFVGVWQGECRDGMPYGEGKLTYGGKTYEGVAEEEQNGSVRFVLDDDGRKAGGRPAGRRDGNEPQRQATGQDSQDSSGDSALAGGRGESRPAEDAEAGAPSAGAGTESPFREYNAVGGDTESRDRGEPVEDGNAGAPPASAARGPEPPAPGDAVPERPARADPSAAPCKLEVAGKQHDWSGPCTGDGKAYGQGRAIGPDGATYTGSAHNGMRHGYGTVTAPDGGWFQGNYRDGVAHGNGTYRAPDGNYYTARFENGEEIGERAPVEYGSLGKGEADNAGNAGDGAADSERWNDSAGGAEDDSWDRGAATDGSDPSPAGAGSATGDPAYAAALEKLEGRGKAGPAAPDGAYVAAIGQLEKREAARRMAAQREAERDAERLRDRIAREQSQKRAARSAAERKRRRATLDRKARRAAERLNRDMDAERARQARKEARRRSEERRRRSRALLDRNVKMARLRQAVNAALSDCSTRMASRVRQGSAYCGNSLCWTGGPGGRNACRARYNRCRQGVRTSAQIERSRCEARARSIYRTSLRSLLARNP